jgi:class 3 adenylate cyclase
MPEAAEDTHDWKEILRTWAKAEGLRPRSTARAAVMCSPTAKAAAMVPPFPSFTAVLNTSVSAAVNQCKQSFLRDLCEAVDPDRLIFGPEAGAKPDQADAWWRGFFARPQAEQDRVRQILLSRVKSTGELVKAQADELNIKEGMDRVTIAGLEKEVKERAAEVQSLTRQLRSRRKRKTAAPRTLEQWAACREAVLAVAFTDIVGSTAMRERLGDEKMNRLLKAHFDSATHVVCRCRGRLVDTGADETLAVFRTASAALCFARTLQTQPGGPNLRIRAGIHVGQISIKGNKPSGQTLHYAKRVLDEAPRGGICLSNQAKADIVQQGRPRLSKVKYRAKRNVKLKGIKGKCTVWLVLTKALAWP